MFQGILPIAENGLGISSKWEGAQGETKLRKSTAECSWMSSTNGPHMWNNHSTGRPRRGFANRVPINPGEAGILTTPLESP